MDSFLNGPHVDELEGPHNDELDNMKEDVDFVDFDMDEFNTCWKEGVDDRGFEDDVPF